MNLALGGIDMVLVETLSDLGEADAALAAAREVRRPEVVALTANRDVDKLAAAFRVGQLYISLDILGDPKGFNAVIKTGNSAAGSEWTMLPPIVPRFRICGCAINGTASCSKGTCFSIKELNSKCRSRAIEPIRITSPSWRMWLNSATRFRSINAPGWTTRKFMAGTRLCPPARILPSPAFSFMICNACSRESGA